MRSDGATALSPRTAPSPGTLAGGTAAAGEAGTEFDGYSFHPLVSAFPRMADAEIDELADDLRLRGAAPILKRGETILDDANRFLACKRAGVEVTFVEWDGSGSLAEVVTRAILPRVHLTESQRAAIAVPISDQLAAETLPTRQAPLRRGTQKSAKTAFPANPPVSANLQQRGMSENCYENPSENEPGSAEGRDEEKRTGRAAEWAAELVGVSTRSVYDARKLRDQARDLFDQVRLGLLNLNRAKLAASKLVKSTAVAAPKSAKRTAAGEDKLIIGDCVMEMAKLGRAVFKLIFADPPYNLGWRYDADPTKDLLPDRTYLHWTRDWIISAADLLTPDGSLFVMIDARWQGRFDVALRDAGLHWRNTIVWRDPFPTHTDAKFQPSARFIHYFTKHPKTFTWNPEPIRVPSRRDEIGDNRRPHDRGIVPHDVWDVPRVVGNANDRVPFTYCPPQVPAAILERIILAASNEGDRVFDPFTGNGTTWRAARKLGRAFTGIERSPLYAAQARQWALEETGK